MNNIMLKSGIIATKIGMSTFFDEVGLLIPITLLKVQRNIVIAAKTKSKHGYSAIAIGYGERKNMTKPLKTIAEKAGINSFALVREFRVSEDCLLEVGASLDANRFIKGQLVDVRAKTIGKGFAGSMKRHNFSGLEASHGVSLSHRAHGSTGQRQDPGKVFKGKKMAGHMGDKMRTIQNLEVIEIDQELSILALKGAIPGAKGSIVCISDASKSYLTS